MINRHLVGSEKKLAKLLSLTLPRSAFLLGVEMRNKTKVCLECKQEKSRKEFPKYIDRSGKYVCYLSRCKKCYPKRQRQYMKKYFKKYPWARALRRIQFRCNNKNHRYHKKGIRNFLILPEVKFLWFRDKAYLMKQPSIDRGDNNGDYSLDNCRFVEFLENLRKYWRERKGLNG